VYALGTHVSAIGDVVRSTAADARAATAQLGTFGVFVLVMRAYSMGAGTYTGIEAVSNGLPILREPRVHTAKKTMRYMAISLAFMAAGLMIGYLLYDVRHQPGKTLNATLFLRMTEGWGPMGGFLVTLTLLSEALLFSPRHRRGSSARPACSPTCPWTAGSPSSSVFSASVS
jgi:hypothetical protein